MKNELVSICIPTYNQTHVLEKTLKSVLAQTYSEYELIISDDSTNQDVFNLLKKYDFRNKIRYYKNVVPLGSPANWNNAIGKAGGKYIKILHHDDWFSSPDSLSEFVTEANKHPDVKFFFSATKSFNHDKNITRYYIQDKGKIDKIRNNPLLLIVGNVIGAPSVTFFKKNSELFDENIKWLVDLDYYIRMIKNNPDFIFINKPLICVSAGATHQITNDCKNIKVEFTEWFYIYNKYKNGKKFSLKEIMYLFKLVYKYKVSSITELPSPAVIPNKEVLTIIIYISNCIRKLTTR